MTTTETQSTPLADQAATPEAAKPAPARDVDRHFRTDHLMADLKGRTVRGGAVTMAAQGIKFVLQMGSTMILARLLTPADFGLVAMVTAVTGFVSMFKEAGLSMATIQREHITHEQVSTLFWINVGLSVAIMLITAALAPLLAWFYGEPRLTMITLAISSSFVFQGLTVQHQALLRRQMRFDALVIVEMGSHIAGTAVTVALGWWTRSYWALACTPIVRSIIGAAAVWVASGWVPAMPKRNTGVGSMVKFGGSLTGVNCLSFLSKKVDNILIGRFWGAVPLGIYSKAYALLSAPIFQANGPLRAVFVPALCRLQADPIRYRRAFLKVMRTMLAVSAVLIPFLSVFADFVIQIILGAGWEQAIIVYRWLSIVSIAELSIQACNWLFLSQGRAKEMFRSGLICAVVAIASFGVGLPWGAMGVAAAYALAGIAIRMPVAVILAGRSGPVSTRLLFGMALPCHAIGALIWLVIWWARYVI